MLENPQASLGLIPSALSTSCFAISTVVGGSCSLAATPSPEAKTETGLDNKSAVAFEKHRIRLRMAAGAWRDYHESIHARLPFVHSCTADAAVQEDLRRADERQERAARNLVQSFTFGAPGVGGGHRHARRGRPSAREFLLSRAAVA